MESSHNKLQNHFFFLLLLIAGVIMYYIFRPFLTALILALSFAVIFKPLYTRILVSVRNRENIAAFITVIFILLIVFVPLMFVGSLLFNEAQGLYSTVTANSGAIQSVNNAGDRLETYLQRFAPDITIDIAQYARYSLQWTISHLDSFFSSFFRVVLGLFIMILALFYILRDGSKLRSQFVLLSPLANIYDDQILTRLKNAINSIVRGSLVIAILQGALASVGVWIFGLPNPIIWGACAVIGSLIPGLGTFIVMAPGILYLFYTQHMGAALGLLIWSVIIVGLVDNITAPFLIGRGIKIHPFLILLSVLGGLAFFGPIGFLLGPIMLAFFFALLDIYPLILKK